MMDWIALLRWVHVIGATVLLGTGAGIAFFMAMAQRTRDPALIAHVAGTVVVADFLFTTSAVVVQPLSGALLVVLQGRSLNEFWLLASIVLYVATGLFWLPVVWIQMRIKQLAEAAAASSSPLPAEEERLFRVWMLLGVPAFASVLAIVWLMLAKPA